VHAVQTHYFFGIARNVTFPGAFMDVDSIVDNAIAKDDSRQTKTQFIRQIGTAASAAEHMAPEIMFRNLALRSDDPAQPQAVSAIKALGVAAAEGQKIYTLSQTNRDLHGTILQSLGIDQDVKTEIADALSAGMEVTVHERNIAQGSWSGSGYLIINPDTGAGAYKIAGGENGAFCVGVGLGALVVASIESLILGPISAGAIIALLGTLIVALAIINTQDDLTRGCFFSGFALGLAIAGAAMLPAIGFEGSGALQGILAAMGVSLGISKVTGTNSYLQCFGFES